MRKSTLGNKETHRSRRKHGAAFFFFFFKKLCIYFKHMPCVRLSLVPEAVTAWGTIWKQRPERDDAGRPRPLGLVDKTSSAWSRQKRWAEAP